MGKYNYPDKISFFKFLFNSNAIANNPIPFHNDFFETSKDDSFTVKPFFSKRIVLTRDAEIAKYILQKKHKNFEKSRIQTEQLSKYVGYGLLTSKGAQWLKQRRLIQPAFHKEKINNLIAIINETVNEQVAKIETNKTAALYPILNVLAFEVIAKSLFNFSADKATLNRMQYIIEQLQQYIVKEIRQPHKKIWYKFNGTIKTHLNLVKEIRGIINTIINTRKNSKENHDDLLDMLLSAQYEDGSFMANEQLIDEIIILFVAGHETTANALTFTLFLLAQNKEALAKAEAESITLKNSAVTISSFGNLNYIKACIEESMRLYPPAWITDRVALTDEVIGGYSIEKGTLIGISIYEIHRNKAYWENPDAFKPERFLEDNKKEIAAHYMPFGAGPRLCIGSNFAMYEMMLVVNKILNTFHIETDKTSIHIKPLITLKPVNAELKFTKK